MQSQGGVPHHGRRNAWNANVDGFGQQVQTVASYAGMGASGTQNFVAPKRAITTDYVDFASGIVQRRNQVVQQVEQARIKVTNISCAMVAKIVVKCCQRFRHVGRAAPVNDVEPLVGVSMEKAKPVFGGCGSGVFRSALITRE